MIGLRVKQGLQRQADDDQRRGHYERPENDFGGERQPPEGRAEPGPGTRCEQGLHGPDGQSDARGVEAAAKKVSEGPFGGLVEHEAVRDADGEP